VERGGVDIVPAVDDDVPLAAKGAVAIKAVVRSNLRKIVVLFVRTTGPLPMADGLSSADGSGRVVKSLDKIFFRTTRYFNGFRGLLQ
jgi:hypothetical protein